MTDAEVKSGLTELHTVALTLYGEARGEPIEGKVFVGSVIRNRVKSPRKFGDSFDKVCLSRLQFSCWWSQGGQANYDVVMARARMFVGDYAERDRRLLDDVLQECLFVSEGIIGGQLRDNARGSTHYLTQALWKKAPPEWAKGQTPTIVVGSQVGFIVK
jgi:N-acetylmuramoyl-L-alanine amidase